MPYAAFDHLEVRCPRLGHQINFGYCRGMDQGLPCGRAITCFYYSFPVEEYFRRVLKEETFARCFLEQGEGRYEKFLGVLSKATGQGGDSDPQDT